MTKDLMASKTGFGGPTFTARNRMSRLLWQVVWLLFARWTPPQMHALRIFLLRIFGARVSYRAFVYPNVVIWAPWNLEMHDFATLGRNVVCYNIAPVSIGRNAVVSQFTHLCTGTHDYRDLGFRLTSKPIVIGEKAWICANAVITPGVVVGEGAILSAGSVAVRDLGDWTISRGNPAAVVKMREPV